MAARARAIISAPELLQHVRRLRPDEFESQTFRILKARINARKKARVVHCGDFCGDAPSNAWKTRSGQAEIDSANEIYAINAKLKRYSVVVTDQQCRPSI